MPFGRAVAVTVTRFACSPACGKASQCHLPAKRFSIQSAGLSPLVEAFLSRFGAANVEGPVMLLSRSHVDVSRRARNVAHINDYQLVARWEPSWHDEVDLRYADQIIGDPDEAGLRLYWGVPDKDSHRQ